MSTAGTDITGGTGEFNVLDHFRLFPEIGQPTWVELIIAKRVEPLVQLHRELADPSVYATVRALALAHGVRQLYAHLAYLRTWSTNRLEPLDWDVPLATGMSIVVTSSPTHLSRVIAALKNTPEILPRRMVW